MKTSQKIKELEEKLTKAEEKYKFRLSRFRGVPHESAQGELSYSDLKVWEAHVNTIKAELEVLKNNEKANKTAKSEKKQRKNS
jgi:hypothetical protein